MLLHQFSIGLGRERARALLSAERCAEYCLSVLKIFRVLLMLRQYYIHYCATEQRMQSSQPARQPASQPTSRSDGLIICRHYFLASARFVKRFIEIVICNCTGTGTGTILFLSLALSHLRLRFTVFGILFCKQPEVGESCTLYNVIWRHIRIVKHAKQS